MSEVQLPLFAEPDIELAESVQDESGRLTAPVLVRRYGDRRNARVVISVRRRGNEYAKGCDVYAGTFCTCLKRGAFETAEAAIKHAMERATESLRVESRAGSSVADELLDLIQRGQYTESVE